MLADQARYDMDDEPTNNSAGGSQFDNGSIELTEENADDFINYINSISSGK
ncbi:hypothetical protein QP580_03475 [Prevotella bivia]|jgi:hypothetical protein|uniref:hypothetical protein n=1 Tax=Prevotella bivia TaxID=28125 RepID=UPI0007E11892|nr:hypothetical protein [Prevotella bivia]KXU57861.1 hypothetical protein HMPREF3218_0201249 [Prevotella bivia]MDK7762515.1 hypothetical protein [Prevotella bivia]